MVKPKRFAHALDHDPDLTIDTRGCERVTMKRHFHEFSCLQWALAENETAPTKR